MKNIIFVGAALALLTISSLSRADSECDMKDLKVWVAEQKKVISTAQAKKDQDALYMAYYDCTRNGCLPKDYMTSCANSFKSLGKEMSTQASAKRYYYKEEYPKAGVKLSAFTLAEFSWNFPQADEAMLNAVRADSKNIQLYDKAVYHGGLTERKTFTQEPYTVGPNYVPELHKVATATYKFYLGEEEKAAKNFAGTSFQVMGQAAQISMQNLELAQQWLKRLATN